MDRKLDVENLERDRGRGASVSERRPEIESPGFEVKVDGMMLWWCSIDPESEWILHGINTPEKREDLKRYLGTRAAHQYARARPVKAVETSRPRVG